MKTLLSIVVMMLVCISTQASNDPSVKTITLEGQFLEKKMVKYEVYKVFADKSCEKVSSHQGVKRFNINLQIGEYYLIKFTSVDGKTKYLYVNVEGGGDFTIDVDFDDEHSAVLTLSKGTYGLQRLSTEEAESLAYVPK